MQIRTFASLLFLFFCISNPLFSQEIQINDEGEKIIVYSDGSWDFYEDAKADPGKEVAIKRAKEAQSELEQVTFLAEEAQVKRYFLEQELEDLVADEFADPDQIETWNQKIEAARQVEKERSETQKEAQKWAKLTKKMVDMSPQKRKKALAKIEEKARKAEEEAREATEEFYVEETEIEEAPTVEIEEYADPIVEEPAGKARRSVKTYDPSLDVILNPPQNVPCHIAFEGEDYFTGQYRRDVAKQVLFTHTDEKIRNYLKGQEYVVCEANMSTGGGFTFLVLKVTVNSKNGQREYGTLSKNSPLTIKLMNGKNVVLLNKITDNGVFEPLNDAYVYKAQYALSNSHVKAFKKSEVDKMRIVWSTGYEDYDIYELDFFINQLNCLENDGD